jgi:NADH-quinone oxidoreductase subunit B
MLMYAMLKLHEQIQQMPLGVNREHAITAAEEAALSAPSTWQMKGLLR